MLKTKEEGEVVWMAFFSRLSNEECYLSINETTSNFAQLQSLIPLHITLKVHDFFIVKYMEVLCKIVKYILSKIFATDDILLLQSYMLSSYCAISSATVDLLQNPLYIRFISSTYLTEILNRNILLT